MNIPSLPVDSIYKFSAFAGLVIIIFCLYTLNSLVETIHDKTLKVQLDLKRVGVEIKFIQSHQKKINQVVESVKEGITSSDIVKKGKMPVEVTKDEYKKMVRELEQLFHDESIKAAELEVFGEELSRLERRMVSFVEIASGATTFGFALSLVGFIFWYIRIQRYQDQIIRNEATKTKTISP